VITHRYLGVTLGGLMLLWCLSGAVMLFVPYPSVSPTERAGALTRIDWSHCCALDSAPPTDVRVRAAEIEQLAGAPVLRLVLAGGDRRMIDLTSGRPIARIGRDQALSVAAAWGRPSEVAPVVRDQWTVGEAQREGPFWRVRLADPAATDIYVAQTSGKAVQRTTAASRVMNWLGAVPHWLYPTLLRQNARLWTQVVIWSSLGGTFLTLCGLWLGLLAWGRARDGRISPFRGLLNWHHLTGLAVGLLTLTWVASGLFSMNPWGFLDSPGDDARERLVGLEPRFGDVEVALAAALARAPDVARLSLSTFDSRPYLMAGDQRLDGRGVPRPMTAVDLAAAGSRLGLVAEQGMISDEDAYYFRHHDAVTLPAWRVRLADGRRYYLDPRSGALLASIDAQARGYRWLHQGLHRLDVVPGFRRGPVWATATLVLLAAVTAGVGLGVWLGLRRIGHDFTRLTAGPRNTSSGLS
jgi:hypothetical protein